MTAIYTWACFALFTGSFITFFCCWSITSTLKWTQATDWITSGSSSIWRSLGGDWISRHWSSHRSQRSWYDFLNNRKYTQCSQLNYIVGKSQRNQWNFAFPLGKTFQIHLQTANSGDNWKGNYSWIVNTNIPTKGLLGLIQATYLTTTPELIPFARSALALARNPDQEFPFLVLSINVSRIALHALRDGLLNRLVMEEESAWTTVNTFYAAVLHHVVERWRREHLTITSSGCVLQEAEKISRSSPASLVRGFERSLASDFTVQSKQTAREQVERDSKEPWSQKFLLWLRLFHLWLLSPNKASRFSWLKLFLTSSVLF